jgi:hypothetical protein
VRWVGNVTKKERRGIYIGYWWESQKERDHWEVQEVGWGDMDWIDLAEDRDHWRALVNTIMNLHVP